MSIKIEYFLGEVSLGKTETTNGSVPKDRIKSANEIGIKYYDRFFLDKDRIDTYDVMMEYDGIMQPLNDFKAELRDAKERVELLRNTIENVNK